MGVTVPAIPARAQPSDLDVSYRDAMQEYRDAKANGATPVQTAQIAADWMAANAWQDLALRKQSTLLLRVDPNLGADHTENLSVRWTGFLTAPASGDYRLEQLRNYYCDGALKVWVDEALVLDSTPQADDRSVPPPDDPRFRSQPVSLTAGQPVSLRVELVFAKSLMLPRTDDFGPRTYPMAVLMWESQQSGRQLIPPASYSPPADFGAGASNGLKAEYFSDSEFQQARFVRLDEGVGLITRGMMLANYQDECDALLEECWEQLNDPAMLAGLTGEAATDFWRWSTTRVVAGRLSVWRRAELAQQLLQQPDLLAAADRRQFALYFNTAVMLPGETRLQLLRTWAKDRELPRTKIAFYPEAYIDENDPDRWQVSRWFVGPYAAELEELVAEDLKKPDGHCRVQLLIWAAEAAMRGQRNAWLQEQIDGYLADESLTGDARASWLVGLAYAEELLAGLPRRPHLALPPLEEAQVAAQSDDLRFLIFGERVTRLVSLGRFDAGEALLESWANPTPEQQQMIAQWETEATELRNTIDQKIAELQQQQQQQRQQNYIATLERRLEEAVQRGDTALAQKYQQMIDQASPPSP